MLLKRPRLFMSLFLGFMVLLVAAKIKEFAFVSNLLKSLGQPPALVYTGTLKKDKWLNIISEPGRFVADDQISVMSKTNGFIDVIAVHSGSVVEKGDLLLSLENQEQYFSLQKGIAAEKLAQSSFSRAKGLYEKDMISKEQYDESLTAYQSAQADLQYLTALMENTVIKAPFSGKVDYMQLSVGQFVPAGSGLFNFTSNPPYEVEFTLAQDKYPYLKLNQECLVKVQGQSHQARLVKIGQVADNITKRFKVAALVQEHHETMIPGGSATVELSLDKTQEKVFIVPLQFIDFTPLGATMWTYIEDESGVQVAQAMVIDIADQHDDKCVISGLLLKDNMPIITDGFQKLRQGGPIKIVELSV